MAAFAYEASYETILCSRCSTLGLMEDQDPIVSRQEQLDPLQLYEAELCEQSLETDEGLSSLWRLSCSALHQQHLYSPETWLKRCRLGYSTSVLRSGPGDFGHRWSSYTLYIYINNLHILWSRILTQGLRCLTLNPRFKWLSFNETLLMGLHPTPWLKITTLKSFFIHYSYLEKSLFNILCFAWIQCLLA